MRRKRAAQAALPGDVRDEIVRASVSFPRDQYLEIERLAEQKKVSIAWVVREATEKYIADSWPLFRDQSRT